MIIELEILYLGLEVDVALISCGIVQVVEIPGSRVVTLDDDLKKWMVSIGRLLGDGNSSIGVPRMSSLL